MIRLANPTFLLIGVIFIPLLLKRKSAFLGYSQLHLLEAEGGSRFWRHLPKLFLGAAIALLVLGLARPQWTNLVKKERFLARDLILVMDLSYSMENTFRSESALLKRADGQRKIDVAKKAAAEFIGKRENDRIGLLVFGDQTFGSWPLTRDVKLILKKLDRLGSSFYGGTNLADPFLKGIDHFTEMGQSMNRILVYVSDGEARIPGKQKELIIQRMLEMDVHFYLLGIQLRMDNHDILDIVNKTGGRFINTDSVAELSAAFEEIDRLEPTVVEIDVQGERQELYPTVVVLALSLMLVATVLRNTLFIELC
jgi:Ca-activated chloride channel family protein